MSSGPTTAAAAFPPALAGQHAELPVMCAIHCLRAMGPMLLSPCVSRHISIFLQIHILESLPAISHFGLDFGCCLGLVVCSIISDMEDPLRES
jgi:hypothetical protein